MDFIILKVNGRDVSHCTHNEAVEAFLTASEPITVEVLRRRPDSISVPVSHRNSAYIPNNNLAKSPSQSSLKENSLASSTTQTEAGVVPPPHVIVPPHPAERDHDFLDEEDELLEEHDVDLLVPGLDYEEVLLQRSTKDERLGLTLCYETDAEDGLTDIFIDDIHPDGLAAQDGRLRLGDQIIQINGIDVKTKTQAQEIFMNSTGDISFLVARPPPPAYEVDLDHLEDVVGDEVVDHDDDNAGLTVMKTSNRNSFGTNGSGDSLMLDSHNTSHSSNGSSKTSSSSKNSKEKVRKASSSSQDSGLRITTEDLNTSKSSQSNSSSISGSKNNTTNNCHTNNLDKELYYVDKKLKDIRLDCEAISAKHLNQASVDKSKPTTDFVYLGGKQQQQQHLMTTSMFCNEPIYETIPEVSENDTDQVYSLPFDNLQHHALISPVRSNKKAQFSENTNGLLRGRNPLNKSQQSQSQQQGLIRSTSLNKYDKNKNFENLLMSQIDAVDALEPDDPQREAKLKEVEYWLKQSLSSPASSNGGLQRTSTTSQNQKANKGLTLQLSNLKSSGSALSLVNGPVNKRKPAQRMVVGKMPLKGTMPRPQSLVTPASTDVMYTDPDHLEATMRLQQEMILQQQQQQRSHQQQQQKRTPAVFQPPPPPSIPPPPIPGDSAGDNWEWKVKIRPDGTRYITRRPARNKLLKERAKKVCEERGMTTDDDAMSELKIGKYWSKDERKKHLEKAKERRLKQLDMIQNKNESMRKSPSASGNLGGYRTKNNKSPITASPPPNTSASSNNGSSNPLMTSEPVLLSVTTV